MADEPVNRRLRRHACVATAVMSAALLCATPLAHAAADEGSPQGGTWEKVETSAADTGDGQVLELPQVMEPKASSSTTGAEGGSGDPNSQLSADSNPVNSPDPLGNLNDYETRPAGVVIVMPPRRFRIPQAHALNLSVPQPPMVGGMFAVRSLITAPSAISPIPATSPMLTPPLGTGAIGPWPLGY